MVESFATHTRLERQTCCRRRGTHMLTQVQHVEEMLFALVGLRIARGGLEQTA